MSTKVKLALIGTGGISSMHAGGILKHQDKVECVALCDLSEANLDDRARQLGGDPRRFNGWKRLLAEMGDELDAVVICLPHHLHAQAIFDAAAAGKHILCEKPMCISLPEADRIVETVAKAGIIYMSGHNQLFTPVLLEMKRMIDAGELGKVRWIRSQDAFVAPADVLKDKWRSQIKYQGGGELIDTGYHPTYRLRFANGVIGEIFTSWAMPLPYGTHDLHVIGDKGQVFGTGNKLYHLPQGEKTPMEKLLPEVDTFAAQMERFADCVQKGTRPPHGPEEGRQVLRIILEASCNADGWQKTSPTSYAIAPADKAPYVKSLHQL